MSLKQGRAWLLVLLCLLTGLAACQGRAPADDSVGTELTGIDHLADHLSVQDFWLDGQAGDQAGKGGSAVCCIALPKHWHAGMTAVVRWDVANWRDCTWQSFERRVAVDPYDAVGTVWVHFLADGSVRVVSSNADPDATDYPGPHDPIPQKEPWKVYGSWPSHCPKKP